MWMSLLDFVYTVNGRMFPDGRLDIFCDILESFCGASCSVNMLMRCCMMVLRVVSGL